MNPSDNKSPQFSETLLSILGNFARAVEWAVSTFIFCFLLRCQVCLWIHSLQYNLDYSIQWCCLLRYILVIYSPFSFLIGFFQSWFLNKVNISFSLVMILFIISTSSFFFFFTWVKFVEIIMAVGLFMLWFSKCCLPFPLKSSLYWAFASLITCPYISKISKSHFYFRIILGWCSSLWLVWNISILRFL